MKRIYQTLKPIVDVIDTLLKPFAWLTALFLFAANLWADLPESNVFKAVEWVQGLLLPEPRIVEQTSLYVYYELGEGMSLTREGRLSPRDQAERTAYEDLEVGDYLFASSTVRIRNAPTASGSVIGRLAAGDCARIVTNDHPLTQQQLGSAITGGWIRITDCTSGAAGGGGF